METKLCLNCGEEIDANTRFCPKCGYTELHPKESRKRHDFSYGPTFDEFNEKHGNKIRTIFVFFFIVGFLLFILETHRGAGYILMAAAGTLFLFFYSKRFREAWWGASEERDFD